MSAKRNLWALFGKLMWFVMSLLLKIVAVLGSRWARNRLDDHKRRSRRDAAIYEGEVGST